MNIFYQYFKKQDDCIYTQSSKESYNKDMKKSDQTLQERYLGTILEKIVKAINNNMFNKQELSFQLDLAPGM